MNLPRKRPRIFSRDGDRTSRAVGISATNYFNGDSNHEDPDEHQFREPIAPVSSQSSSQNSTQPRARRAEQSYEFGESNQMDTDIEYFIESLDIEKNKTDIRCLSLLGLAKKLMSSEYRMHMKAHDITPRIITKVIDAPNDPSLALSCATLMFVANQDHMKADINAEALKLLLKLIRGSDNVHSTDKVEKKHKDTVMELITQMRDTGHGKYLNMDKITAANLATETLLGLTAKRAGGEWFKDEIRSSKGIDFVLETVASIAETDSLETNDALMNKLDRCMNLLQDITTQNSRNQEYITRYNDGILIDSCLDLLTLYKREITIAIEDKQINLFTTALQTTLRVLNHVTSETNSGSVIGSRTELTELILYFINDLQEFIKLEHRSDVTMNCVCLLINMVEFNRSLRSYLMSESRINDLIDTFYKRVHEAQKTEQQADQLLNSNQRVQMTEAMQDSLIDQVITKSGKHMEHSVIAACLAILFGCIIQDNPDFRERLISYLRNNSVDPLIDVLQKLHDFANLANIMPQTGVDRVKRILKVLKLR